MKIKNAQILCLYMFFACVCSSAFAAKVEEHPPVAVMEFGIHRGASAADVQIENAGKTASEYIVYRLIQDGRCVVMERDTMQQKLDEEGLDTVGLIDPDTARRIGELLNVRYLIYGNVNDVGFSSTGTSTIVGGVDVGTVKAHVIARVMRIETGDIVTAAKGEGKSKSSFVKAGTPNFGVITIGTKTVTQDSVHNAIQKASSAAVDTVLERLYGKKVNGHKQSETHGVDDEQGKEGL